MIRPALYESRCPLCHYPIKVGDRIVYLRNEPPGEKARHAGCDRLPPRGRSRTPR